MYKYQKKYSVFKGENRYWYAMKAKQLGREVIRVGNALLIENIKVDGEYRPVFALAA